MQRIKELTYGVCYVVINRTNYEKYKHNAFCSRIFKDLEIAKSVAKNTDTILKLTNGIIKEIEND